MIHPSNQGILLVNKPKGKTSFSLVASLRKLLNVQKIGHAGTLDPFATGVMVMLVGKDYTRQSEKLLTQDKEYVAELTLGVSTDSYDCDGKITQTSTYVPTLHEIEIALKQFQGEVKQIPPMFSAKKIKGKRLYELARAGKVVEREPVTVKLETTLISYSYPHLNLKIACSKGTYIRSIAEDLGKILTSGAHLSALVRVRSGKFTLDECIDGQAVCERTIDVRPHLRHANP